MLWGPLYYTQILSPACDKISKVYVFPKSQTWSGNSALCYSGFHHTRWITHCMAFPYPAADSLFPMDHLLYFDVSLTIPKNIRKMIYASFSPITTYIRGYSLYSRVHRDVCIIQNCWSVPWLGSDSYDSWPSICLEITRIQPFSITLESYIRNHWDIESNKRELRVPKL